MEGESWDDWTATQRSALVTRILNGELTVKDACQRHSLSADQIREWMLLYRRQARQAIDAQLTQVFARQGIDASDLHAAEFTGSIGEIAVADLLQTIAMVGKDGVLTVSHHGQESRLWCAAGQIVDAESGRLTGVPAVYRILALERGQVRADLRSIPRERVIHDSTPRLLLEGARRRDECLELRRRLGAEDQVYVPSPRALLPEASSQTAQSNVLRLCSTGCTMDQLLAGSGHDDLETLQALSRLIEQGHLTADERLTAGRRTPPPPEVELESAPASSLFAHVASAGPQRLPSPRWSSASVLLALCVALGAAGAVFGWRSFRAPPDAPAVASRPAPELPTLPAAPPEPLAVPPATAEPAPSSGSEPALVAPPAPAPPPEPAAARAAVHHRAAPRRMRRNPTASPAAANSSSSPSEPAASSPKTTQPQIQIIQDRDLSIEVIE